MFASYETLESNQAKVDVWISDRYHNISDFIFAMLQECTTSFKEEELIKYIDLHFNT